MSQPANSETRSVSGRGVVAAMFLLGILATAFLWTYWTIRMTPFMPLQEALEAEFPDSSPRVEDGVLKKSGQSALKVVLRTDFDPRAETEASESQIRQRLERTRDLADELLELQSWEILALHLYHPLKERGISQRTFFRDIQTWDELDTQELIGWEPDPARERPQEPVEP